MRPLPRKQNPTSFIRKWPRERRQQRLLHAPNEIIKKYTVDGCESALEAGARLGGLVTQPPPKGYIRAEVSDRTWALEPGGYTGQVTVTYRRKEAK